MWLMQTEALNEISNEDPEVKTEVKVCTSSLKKLSSPLSDYFQNVLPEPALRRLFPGSCATEKTF